MKDVFKENIISEFDGLNSKMYSLADIDGKESKKANGVNRGVARGLRHKKFVNFFFNKVVMRHKMKRIQIKLHRIGTYDV